MMNSEFVVTQAAEMAERIRQDVGDDPAAQLRRAWLLAFSRLPSPDEVTSGVAFLSEQGAALAADEAPSDAGAAEAAAADKPKSEQPAEEAAPPAALTALAHLCHALLISNEFLYVD